MVRVFLVHKWEGKPADDWYPWLKKMLEATGFEVHVPEMPDTTAPKIEEWISFLNNIIAKPDVDTYLVGHSIGCQAIMRYLAGINETVGGIVLVAGWITLKDEALSEEEWLVAQPWCRTPIDWKRVKGNSKHITVILSKDDPYVSLDNAKLFEERLGARVLVQPGAGHFEKVDGFSELHVALNELMKMIER